MPHRIKLAIGATLAALVLAMANCGVAADQANGNSGASVVGKATLLLGRQWVLPVSKPPTYSYCVLQNAQGRIWVIWADILKLTAVMHTNASAEPTIQQVPPKNWKFVNHCTATLDASGRPYVIWSGYDETTGEAVAASHWRDDGWSNPAILDRLVPCKSVNSMVSVLDSAGNIHVVYDRPLDPYEQYARGSIVVSGEFPTSVFICPSTGGNGPNLSRLRAEDASM